MVGPSKEIAMAGRQKKENACTELAREARSPRRAFVERSKKRPLDAVKRLQLGVGVRANFAVEVDFFVLRSSPFHGRRLRMRGR